MNKSASSFTPQARVTAAKARRVRALQVIAARNELEVFAIRVGTRFIWQIRKFGGVVVMVDDQTFETAEEAWTAGKATLASTGQIADEMADP